MKFTSLAACAASVFLALISCRKSAPDTPDIQIPVEADSVVAFTLVASDKYYEGYLGSWLLIHNPEGKLQFQKEFKKGDSIVYRVPKKESARPLTITLAYSSKENTTTSVLANTYVNVSQGRVWRLPKTVPDVRSEQQGESNGTFQVDIGTEPGEVYDINYRFGGTTSMGSSYYYNPDRTVITSARYSNANRNLVVKQKLDRDPQYYFLENPKADSIYHVDQSDFQTYDHVVSLNVPPATQSPSIYYQVNDVANERYPYDGFYMVHIYPFAFLPDFHNNPPLHMRLGYLDRFETYHTNISIWGSNHVYEYEAVGPRPNSIDFPDVSKFAIVDTSLRKYSYTHAVPFLYRTAVWNYLDPSGNMQMNWYVHAEMDVAQPLLEMPESTFPLSGLRLKYAGTAFTTDGFSLNQEYNFYEGKTNGNPLPPLKRVVRINP